MRQPPKQDSSDTNASWILSQPAWDRLLAFLDPDRERAGRLYERTRERLIRLFEWRGCPVPDELTDMTLNRVARKLEQGEQIETADPYAYFCGVARLVFLEYLRRRQRERSALDELLGPPLPQEERGERERLLQCLERAVDSLTPRSRRIIMSYYRGEKREKIDNRRRLADELAIPLNALRIRAHRIRAQLESRVALCIEHLSAN